VAGTVLLGVAGAPARLARLPVTRAEIDRRLGTSERAMADHDRMVAGLLGLARELTHRLAAIPAAPGPAAPNPGAGCAAWGRRGGGPA
jgi:hypothetical protein